LIQRSALITRFAERTSQMRFDRGEAGGALGDLGTFLPLLVGMVSMCGLQLGPAVLCSGVMNLATGLVFGIPLPVQPMKAIAVVAIAEGLREPQILAAGIATGAVILVLTGAGLIDRLRRAIPLCVVRGLQLAIGLKLLTEGVRMIAGTHTLIGWDSIGLGVLCAGLVWALYGSTRVPSALVIFAVGLAALIGARPALLGQIGLGMSWRLPNLANPSDWAVALWRGTLPQIPLTLLNSVIAVSALSVDLFPHRPAAPRRLAFSVALMNLVTCPLGGMPLCHGAGGLAAQYRFGARTGGSMVMLGTAKIFLALLFGSSLLTWLQAYPASVLGVLLLFGGLELALVCRDQIHRRDFLVVLLTAGLCLGANTTVGFIGGWTAALLALWRGLLTQESPRSVLLPPQGNPPAGVSGRQECAAAAADATDDPPAGASAN
jgi:hypothetical protein